MKIKLPKAPRDDGRYPTPAYLEGYFGLPEFSVQTGHEPLDVMLGKMSEEVYMGYLGKALSLAKTGKLVIASNETESSRPKRETKRNETKFCLCGCGQDVPENRYGRKAKFASPSCRVRYHRQKNKSYGEPALP